jgi:ABC-2 type transport system ATP-binding protein
MATPAINVRNLTKRYGTVLAVDDVSFQVQPGELVGFLGPNGAGKSTCMRILTTWQPASSGYAWLAGNIPQPFHCTAKLQALSSRRPFA